MKIGIYPGSFDPITLGHLDIIVRASGLVDHLIIAVLKNSKKHPLLTSKERVELIQKVLMNRTDLPSSIEVVDFDGLLIDFARQRDANIIVRGLRAITDFEYELQIAQTNHKLNPAIDTIFFTTSVEYSYVSSTAVKEIASFNGDISQFVPKEVVGLIYDKFNEIRSI